MPKTTIASFVLRFTQEHPSDAEPAAPWRAVVRHVQSDEEVHFTQMDEALAFIGQYVDLLSRVPAEVQDDSAAVDAAPRHPVDQSDEASHRFER